MKKRNLIGFIITISLIACCMIFGFIWIHSINSENRKPSRFDFDKPEGLFQYIREITTPFGAKSSGYSPNYAYRELIKANKSGARKK